MIHTISRPAFRGGGWRHAATVAEVSSRFKSDPDALYMDVSFRLIRFLTPLEQIAAVHSEQ